MIKNKIGVIAAALCIVTLSIITYFYVVIKISSPLMSGEVRIEQLSDKVSIHRDSEGVPHIYAKKRTDMYFGLGFVMASDRLFQYDMIRRAGSGTTAEIIGSKTLEVDKLFRVLGADRTFKDRIKLLPKEVLADFKSYTDGLNFYIDNYPAPVEYKILRVKPKKFSIMDAYYVYTYLAYSFSPMLKQDQMHSSIASSVKGRDLDMLTSVGTKRELKTTTTFNNSSYGIDKVLGIDKILANLSPIEGSNAWAIDGQRTKSGAPILASDPHITFSLPNIWYEAHLNSEEDSYEMYGLFLPLIPYPAMGHNRDYGWGLTMSYMDDMDLFQEEIKDGNYTFKGISKPLNSRKETIRIRGEEDHVMNVAWTFRGPLADNIIERKGISLNWAYYLNDNKPMLAFYNMSRAKSLDDVRAAVKHGKSPGMNIIYADKSGNIAQLIFGALYKRSHPEDSNHVNNKDNEILGVYDFDLKPHRKNPVDGIIISTNDKPDDSNISERIDLKGLWYPKNRHDTIEYLLKMSSKWDAKKMRWVQISNLDIFALKYRDKIISVLRGMGHHLNDLERKAMAELIKWDGLSAIDSVGASIYNHFNYKFFPVVLDELSSSDLSLYCNTTASWNLHQRLFNDLENRWWDNQSTDKIETSQETIVKVFKETVKSLKRELGNDISSWKWGRLHTIEFPHAFGMNKLLGKVFNKGPYPIAGAINVINHNRRKGCENGHAVKSGPSSRRVIDFSRPEVSFGILPLGNSGHMLSPFYDDQRERFLKGQYRNQYLNLEDIKKNLHSTLILKNN